MQETLARFLGWEDRLEEGRQPTPVFSPGKSPWTKEPGGLQPMGLQTVRHNWATNHSIWTGTEVSNKAKTVDLGEGRKERTDVDKIKAIISYESTGDSKGQESQANKRGCVQQKGHERERTRSSHSEDLDFQFGKINPGEDGEDGCTTMWIHLMPLKCTLKNS